VTGVDRFIQRWRIRKAGEYIPRGARVLDIGCADGAMFKLVRHIGSGIGIDPLLTAPEQLPNARVLPGLFPDVLSPDDTFDAITMLAVLEHVPREAQRPLAMNCARFLRPGGRLIITVPSPAVDKILDVLGALRLIHGMSLEQHYGFKPEETPSVFGSAGLTTTVQRRFQFGLNNLFVFTK
jgi:2-polyprenyl-3-methyl-5-hydroxy-6-metoxy-1,4-benzoquinol methylase